MHEIEPAHRAVKEEVSSDKMKSVRGLIFGTRALQFDALLKKAPTSDDITAITRVLHKPHIRHMIFDLDGTLEPPYASVTEETINLLKGYQEQGRSVGILSNSPYSDRFKPFLDNGMAVAMTCFGKPTLEAYEYFCEKHKMDPTHTAMVGNFPVTDLPLVEEGQPPFFPLNILTKSIPPQRKLVESWSKYFRASLFHAISVFTTEIVRLKNPNLLRDI
jgi:predicted HAD superfamily phosphohydrolase YqeG